MNNIHSVQLAHLPVPSDIKHKIAAKLHDGVSIEKILDDIRDSMPIGQNSHEQLLSRQDILNIQHQLNVESIQKHTNHLLSTCAWDEMQTMQYNPVLLFKQQGGEQTEDMS